MYCGHYLQICFTIIEASIDNKLDVRFYTVDFSNDINILGKIWCNGKFPEK